MASPRLVRGVAGSGKTVVLAHWLAKTAERLCLDTEARILVVYANKALQPLIEKTTEQAWKSRHPDQQFPWWMVDMQHVKGLLELLYAKEGLGTPRFGFDYEEGSRQIMTGRTRDQIAPLCNALFVDEAQDFGHDTLHLLTWLVRRGESGDERERSFIVFYDNAQNLYGRGVPRWSEFGLDMRGRSTVLKEGFRSTQPLSEFALNVLYRLQAPDGDADHRELVDRGLIERVMRNDRFWWKLRFNSIDGPLPVVKRYRSLESEIDAIGNQIIHWITDQGVVPSDIRVLYMGDNIPYRINQVVAPRLKSIGARLACETSRGFGEDANTVVVTTPHSFKGYDAEVIIVAAANQFCAKDAGILPSSLYVALTRARSVLEVYGQDRKVGTPGARIMEILEQCAGDLIECDSGDARRLGRDDLDLLIEQLGDGHRGWIETLAKKYALSVEPLLAPDGRVLPRPVFTIESANRKWACLGNVEGRRRDRQILEDAGIDILDVGGDVL